MIASHTRLLMTVVTLPLLAEFAQAQGPLRRFDDLTFAALAAARDLRWEIHDEFARSRDQRHLLKDVENLIDDLHQLQKSIYLGRSPRLLDRELDHAFEHIAELKEHLLGCDFAMQRPGAFQYNANGYVFHPETRHGGRVHVDHAIQMLAGIEANLAQLHRELTGTAPPTVGPTPVPAPVPGRPAFPGQIQPYPQGPLMIPPTSSSIKGTPVKNTQVKSLSVKDLMKSFLP